MVSGQWLVVSGQWSVVSIQWSVAIVFSGHSGQWSVVSDYSMYYGVVRDYSPSRGYTQIIRHRYTSIVQSCYVISHNHITLQDITLELMYNRIHNMGS